MSGTASNSSYSSTAASDVVAVFDNKFNQLFPDARAMNADVKEIVKRMTHPVETGAEITDHKVILPISIRLTMILTPETYVDTYEQIRSLKTSNQTVQIQTKTGLYSSMVLGEMPHKEDVEHYDTIAIQLTFHEVLFVTASSSKLPKAVNSGNKNGKEASVTDGEHGKEKVQHSSAAYSLIYGKGKTADATEH